MNRLFVICAAAIVALSCTMGFCSYSQGKAEVPSASSGGSLYSKYEDDVLSVDIKDAALEEILRKLSEQTGITFSLPPSLSKERLMVRFSKFTIDEGINKILAPYDRIFIYDGTDVKTEGSQPSRLKEVRIYLKENNPKKGSLEPPMIISAKGSESSPKPAEPTAEEKKQVVKASPREDTVKSVEELTKDLQEGNETAKVNALYGLARSGGEAAIGPLTSALEDKNPVVSKEAESALADLYANLEENNPSDEPPQPIEGTPRFAMESTGPITQGAGNQIEVDIRLTDVPEKLITGGFMINYDASQMKIVGVDVYDGSGLTGPWDSQMTNKVENPNGPGTFMVVVGNLASVAPDENSNINMARARFQCTGSCDSAVSLTPVSGFDTIVGNSSNVYDSKMPQFTIPIN